MTYCQYIMQSIDVSSVSSIDVSSFYILNLILSPIPKSFFLANARGHRRNLCRRIRGFIFKLSFPLAYARG